MVELLEDLLPDLISMKGGIGASWQVMSVAERFYGRARGLAVGSGRGTPGTLEARYFNGASRALVECVEKDPSQPDGWSALGVFRA